MRAQIKGDFFLVIRLPKKIWVHCSFAADLLTVTFSRPRLPQWDAYGTTRTDVNSDCIAEVDSFDHQVKNGC